MIFILLLELLVEGVPFEYLLDRAPAQKDLVLFYYR